AYNDGSGGAIRLVAPILAGTGILNVNGNWGGDGRIRLDALDRRTANFNYTAGAATVSSGALMIVFPTPLPRLDIVEAAGTSIALSFLCLISAGENIALRCPVGVARRPYLPIR